MHRHGPVRRYAEAVVAAGVALFFTWLFHDALAGTRLLLFWVLSVFVAWRGGVGPVILAALLSVVIWDLVLPGAFGHLGELTRAELFSVAVYTTVSTILGYTFDNLRRARLRVAQAADGMIDAMVVLDEEWRMRFANKAAVSIIRRVGIEISAVRRQSIWEAVPGLVGTPFETETRRAREGRRIIEFEAQYPASDLWLQVRAAPTADGGVAVFAHDVTPAQRAEYERLRADQRYRALVEATTVMVWSTNADGSMRDIPVWREITGQTTEEMQGAGWLTATHPDDRPRVESGWHDAVAHGRAYDGEFRLRHKDGAYLWYHARAVPIRDGEQIVEWFGVFDDVQDVHLDRQRHAAVDNALGVLGASLDYEWNLAAVMRLLIPTLADYCSVDLVDETGTLRRVSSAHVDPEKEEVLRELWRKFPYRPGDPGSPEVLRTGQSILMPHVSAEDLSRSVRSEEQAAMAKILAPRSWVAVPMSSHGEVFGALSLVYSDSGRTYGPADLAAIEQIAARAGTAIENARLYTVAQAANRAKSDFLATMSHELRTPLNAIAGYADLLSMGVRGPITEDQRRDLSRIRQNQQHLLEIITDILNFSRIEAGHTRYELTSLRVNELLARMEALVEPLARARSITYAYEPPGDDLLVTADREKLEQVLINLLGNAVKFTPHGGHVRLSAEGDNGVVRINVRDDGVGIAPSQLASIFEPFVQLEPAFTRTTEGTGLGLAISRELTRGMGGELRAVSAPGLGSTFTVELPRGE